jgi:hypothetical protein
VLNQDPEVITDGSITTARGFKESKPHHYLKYDFFLVTPEEGEEARKIVIPLVAG